MASFTVKKKELANVIKAIGAIVDEAAFQVKDGAITFRGMSKDHVSMMSVEISDFIAFAVPEPVTFGVRLDELKKVVARFKDTITVDITDKVRLVENAKTYEISIIDVPLSDAPLPLISFTCKLTMTKDELLTALQDVAVSSLFVAINADEKVVFSGRGDNASVSVEPVVQQEGKGYGNYSLEFIMPVVSAVDVDEATVQFGEKTPVLITLGNIRFYLAPRVND